MENLRFQQWTFQLGRQTEPYLYKSSFQKEKM